MHVNFILPNVRKQHSGYLGGFLFTNGVAKVPLVNKEKAERLLCRFYGCTMEVHTPPVVEEPKRRAISKSKARAKIEVAPQNTAADSPEE